jgi:hypothetical protein
MKTKLFGLALVLSLSAVVGACAGGNQPTDTSTPADTTSPAGEPVDNTTSPAATTQPESTPTATPTETP